MRAWPPGLAVLLLALLLLAACGTQPAAQPAPASPAEPALAALIHDLVDGTDLERRKVAHDALIARGKVVVAPLAAALDREDVDAGVGAWIAEVLGSLGEEAAPAAPALYRRLIQGGECSATTSWALKRVGPTGVPWLAKALASPHPQARIWATDALSDLATDAEPAAEALRAALDDEAYEVRWEAARAMASMPPETQVLARPRLLALTRDEHEEVREAAARSLAGVFLEDPSVRTRLQAMVLGDADDDFLRENLLEALDAHLGREAESLRFLRAVLELPDGDHDLHRRATAMLLQRGADDHALVAAFADVDRGASPAERLRRARTLLIAGPHGREAALPLLVFTLKWSDEAAARAEAATLLGLAPIEARADADALKALRLHADPAGEEPEVVEACEQALERIGPR